MTAEVKDLIPQAIVAYHNISSMSAGHSMMTKRIKGHIRAEWPQIDLKCPVSATTLWPSGIHWTRGASPSQVKGPLIAKRKNEGLPLTGDELRWCERKTPIRWRKVGPRSFQTKPSG